MEVNLSSSLQKSGQFCIQNIVDKISKFLICCPHGAKDSQEICGEGIGGFEQQ